MNELQIFQNNVFGQVRVVEQDGEPWFVATDICKCLEIGDTSKATKRLDDDEKGATLIPTLGGKQKLNTVNEYGLYNLVLSSRKPEAKEFKRWITHEVIPTIRKHGAYMTEDVIKQAILTPDFLIGLAQELKAEQEKNKELTALTAYQEQQIAEFKPVKDYVDRILSTKSTMTITQIAADYDLSAVKLNKILHEAGLQRKVGNQWILYKQHMTKGYTKSETITFTRSDGRLDCKVNTKWTQKGRLKIHEILTEKGYQPVCMEVR